MDALALFLLSAATLAFEINLTRIFSVAQFYHFAFMTVSLALLGFGASGTVLALFPGLVRHNRRVLTLCAWGMALTAVGSYGLTLWVPFDSFSVVLDPAEWGVLGLHYLALSLPFLCSGMAVGLQLTLHPSATGRTYAANLAGSATGCVLALTTPSLLGSEGVVFFSAALAGVAGMVFSSLRRLPLQALSVIVLIVCAIWVPPAFEVRLSPYKGLSYALQYPDVQLISSRWNGFSRVDVVDSEAVRSLPGQGFACSGQPPRQRGLYVDGDNLSPITHLTSPADIRPFTDCLLLSVPYRLRPEAQALVMEPQGGFGLLVALAEGAEQVVAVQSNPLVFRAVQAQGEWAGSLYEHPQIQLSLEEGRSHLSRPGDQYDIIFLPPPGTYHPVASGAYSLAEDYAFTVEGALAALERLRMGGMVAIVRWLQTPPSESLRAFALVAEAVERFGGDPSSDIVAVRSYNQIVILARRGPFAAQELDQVREFAAGGYFDLVYLPDLEPGEVNRYNVLTTPEYHLAFTALLSATDRQAWLEGYPFDVTPPTDDHPFFGHYFRWGQAREVLAMAGHVWQPFGGTGYLVLLGLLVVSITITGLVVLLPLALQSSARRTLGAERSFGRLLPFALLGLAFMLVEIPLLQRFILFLGHPTYAMATVLGSLLLFSGVGSLLSKRARLGRVLPALVVLILLYQVGFDGAAQVLLGLPLAGRIVATALGLAPLGILMGMPFPISLDLLQERAPALVPWAWGVNGALSVVASVLAAIAAITWGFGMVLALGALSYLGVWLSTVGAIRTPLRFDSLRPPGR